MQLSSNVIFTATTTEAPTTTTTTEAPKGRGALTAGRNRFKLQPKAPASTEAPAEVTSEKPKNRFSRPSSSFSRNSGSRATKTSVTTAPEEVVEKVETPTQSTSKLATKPRNRFNLRTQGIPTTEKPADSDSTTVSRLLKPRPTFNLRNRSRNGPATASTTESSDVTESTEEKEEKSEEKTSSVAPKPTSRLGASRPASRLLPGQKARTSPLNPRRGSSTDENGDVNKSANENESDLETTTQNNLNKLKSRPRIQINTDSKAKKIASSPVVNRKVNPLISKRKFGVTSTTGTITFCIFICD